MASRRRWEIESRVRRLNENLEAWEKAERIRRYASALADTASRRGPIEPASDLAKVAWVGREIRRLGRSVDRTTGRGNSGVVVVDELQLAGESRHHPEGTVDCLAYEEIAAREWLAGK
jgi:hypothetical protein